MHGDRKVSGVLGEHKEARVGLSSRRAVGGAVRRQARVCWERPGSAGKGRPGSAGNDLEERRLSPVF